MPGCRGSKNQSGATTSGDPSDVNAAEAQSSCPAGQVLMSDGSCASSGQTQPAEQAPALAPAQAPAPSYAPQPAQQAPAPAPAPSYAPQPASAPQQQDQSYPQQQSAPQDYAQNEPPPQQDDQSGNYDPSVYETQNPYDDQTYQQDAYNDGYQAGL